MKFYKDISKSETNLDFNQPIWAQHKTHKSWLYLLIPVPVIKHNGESYSKEGMTFQWFSVNAGTWNSSYEDWDTPEKAVKNYKNTHDIFNAPIEKGLKEYGRL